MDQEMTFLVPESLAGVSFVPCLVPSPVEAVMSPLAGGTTVLCSWAGGFSLCLLPLPGVAQRTCVTGDQSVPVRSFWSSRYKRHLVFPLGDMNAFQKLSFELQIHRKLQRKLYRKVLLAHLIHFLSLVTSCVIEYSIKIRTLTLMQCVCIVVCHLTTPLDSCNQYCHQDGELFRHHRDLHLCSAGPLTVCRTCRPPSQSVRNARWRLICLPSLSFCHFKSVKSVESYSL